MGLRRQIKEVFYCFFLLLLKSVYNTYIFFPQIFLEIHCSKKICVFLWRATWEKVYPLDRVQKRWSALSLAPQAWLLCLRAAELVQHLFLHCKVAGGLSSCFCPMLDSAWGRPRFHGSFSSSSGLLVVMVKEGKTKKLWVMGLHAVCWTIWFSSVTRVKKLFLWDYYIRLLWRLAMNCI